MSSERRGEGQKDDGGGAPLPSERLLLAWLGWLSLGAEAADELADEVARRAGIDRDEVRTAVLDTISSWRADARRAVSSRGELGERLISRLGLVRREQVDEVELRLAQLEHRLRLLEQRDGPRPSA